MSVHYDSLAINRNMALDLPFREGAGTITHSLAKTHPLVTIVDVGGVWTTLDSHLSYLTLTGAADYLWASAADTLNLDFTSEDYSIGCWFRADAGEDDNKTLISRFVVSDNGWEIYHYTNLILTLRHHAGTPAAPIRTGAHCGGWAYNKWWFMGVSRHGDAAQFWRGDINGFAVISTTVSAGGLIDPETCAVNLNIGRSPANENHWNGGIWRPRIWFQRYITGAEWQQIWEKEVEWFRS